MRDLPMCSTKGCDNRSDPRWYIYWDGCSYPACDGCGGSDREPKPEVVSAVLTEAKRRRLAACPDCGYDWSPSGGSDFTAAVAEYDRLRAALAASEREAERLRKLFDDAGQGEYNVLALVDHWQDEALKAKAEVELCREIIAGMTEDACDVGRAVRPEDRTLDSHAISTNSDALRYLAEIGRVEIISEAGRRVVARWVK